MVDAADGPFARATSIEIRRQPAWACATMLPVPLASQITVRPAGQADADATCTIYNAALAERTSTFETSPRSALDFEEKINDVRFPLLVAETAGKVIGWAGLASYSSRPCYSGITECSVYVAAVRAVAASAPRSRTR